MINFAQKNAIAFQGDLTVITVENLMQLVGYASLYGELRITTLTNSAVLFVHEGTLVYNYLERNPIKIGQLLIHGNYITSEQLEDCLFLCQSKLSRPKIGRILVKKKYLQQEDLEKVYKEQSKAVFFEILSWQKGSFAFFVKRISKSEDIFLRERIDHLTLKGILSSC